MSREFRIAVTIALPDDEEHEALTKIDGFKVKAGIVKLLEEHGLKGQVTHDTVQPRTSTPKIVPGAPSVASEPAPLSGGAEKHPAPEGATLPPHTGHKPPLRGAVDLGAA